MTTVIPTPYDTEIAAIQAGLKRPIYFDIHKPAYLGGAQTGYRVAKAEGAALLEAAKASRGQWQSISKIRWFKKDAAATLIHIQSLADEAMQSLETAIAATEGV